MHLSRMELFFSKYTNSYVHIYKVAPTADTTVVSKVEGIEPKFNWASKSETSAKFGPRREISGQFSDKVSRDAGGQGV